MKFRLLSALLVVFTLPALCQDAPSTPATPQSGRQGQRDFGGRRAMGPSISGTVTAVAADHYTISTDGGDTYTVQFTAETRILKQVVRSTMSGQDRGQDRGPGGNPPPSLKPSEIKIGDSITARGPVDATAKTVTASLVLQLDPERLKELRAQQANFGITWLQGEVTAIDGVKVTVQSPVDHAAHSFLADENTTFRKRRDPITLADIAVGDQLRTEGAVKDGSFVATAVNVLGMPPAGTPTLPRTPPPAATPSTVPQTK